MTKCRLSWGASGAMCRLGSPSGGSTLMTWAPPSASTWAAHGTATNCPSSSTVTPANGRSLIPVFSPPGLRAVHEDEVGARGLEADGLRLPVFLGVVPALRLLHARELDH